MARHDLIAPTGAVQAAEAGRRRRAAWFAILSAGALLSVLVVSAVFGGERPAALAPSGENAMGAVHEAQSAAQGAVANVATFLAALKAQKAAPSRSEAHALDWNWAPELRRDKSISNWVGSDWVKPLVGDREIKQIAPPRFGAAHDRLTAAKVSEGLASRVTSGSPAEQIPPMPSLLPLHYFIGKAGHSDWNTRCVAAITVCGCLPCPNQIEPSRRLRCGERVSRDAIKMAKHSVDFVQEAVKSRAHTPEAAPPR